MEDREGRTGYWISGVAHGSLILWAILGGALFRPQPAPMVRTTQVSTISGAEFEALAAAARGAGPVGADATAVAALAPVDAADETTARPVDAAPPQSAQAEALAEPDVAETAPDLSDFAPAAPVNVATDLPTPNDNQTDAAEALPQVAPTPPAPVAEAQPSQPAAPVPDAAAQPVAPRSALALDASPRPQDRPAGLVEAFERRVAEAAAAEAAQRAAAQAAAQAAADAQAQAERQAAAAEAERQAAAAAAADAERQAAAEAERAADADRQAAADAERRAAEAERRAAAERDAAEAERQAAADAARQAEAEAARRAEAERAAEAERTAEAERAAVAERQAAADAERRATEAVEAERRAAAEQAAEAERRAEAERAAEAERQVAAEQAAREAADRQAREDALRDAQTGGGGQDIATGSDAQGGQTQTIEGGSGASAGLDPLAAALAGAMAGTGAAADPANDPAGPPADMMRLTPSPMPATPLSDPAQGLPMGDPLTLSERDGLRFAIQNCWNVGALSVEASQMTVSVGFTLSPGGVPDQSSLRIAGYQGGSEGAAQQAFDVARRAILMCGQAGFDLPASKYGRWRDVVVDFRPDGVAFQ
ncbi:MAG: protein TolA [Paracoccus hibiscisoli]|uniref:protein TolA n=1 Tax=Paracoccus hibiscisoli TaxID=2023261 RepID=UPI00391B8E9D